MQHAAFILPRGVTVLIPPDYNSNHMYKLSAYFYTADCGELTIDRVQIAYSDSQFVGSIATLTCDTGNGFVFAVNGVVFSDENDVSEQRTCTLNNGWTLSGLISLSCIRKSIPAYRGAQVGVTLIPYKEQFSWGLALGTIIIQPAYIEFWVAKC